MTDITTELWLASQEEVHAWVRSRGMLKLTSSAVLNLHLTSFIYLPTQGIADWLRICNKPQNLLEFHYARSVSRSENPVLAVERAKRIDSYILEKGSTEPRLVHSVRQKWFTCYELHEAGLYLPNARWTPCIR